MYSGRSRSNHYEVQKIRIDTFTLFWIFFWRSCKFSLLSVSHSLICSKMRKNKTFELWFNETLAFLSVHPKTFCSRNTFICLSLCTRDLKNVLLLVLTCIARTWFLFRHSPTSLLYRLGIFHDHLETSLDQNCLILWNGALQQMFMKSSICKKVLIKSTVIVFVCVEKKRLCKIISKHHFWVKSFLRILHSFFDL